MDKNLSTLEELLPVVLRLESERIVVTGDASAVDLAHRVMQRMREAVDGGKQLSPEDVVLAARRALDADVSPAVPDTLYTTQRGKEVRPRTVGQQHFVEAIERFPLVFGIGPAGTGKTFLAVTMAIRALRARQVQRIVLSRPAVEAGEKLGFLPGDYRDKVDPYLRPLFDALRELIEDTAVERFIERGTIEVAPLAFMRGRTLSDAFVILDEAQNATRAQLKMFLTRLGPGSRMVVNGDITQIDLPRFAHSGLLDVRKLFESVLEIGIVELTERDVVRHPLVAKIVSAYEHLK